MGLTWLHVACKSAPSRCMCSSLALPWARTEMPQADRETTCQAGPPPAAALVSTNREKYSTSSRCCGAVGASQARHCSTAYGTVLCAVTQIAAAIACQKQMLQEESMHLLDVAPALAANQTAANKDFVAVYKCQAVYLQLRGIRFHVL